MMKFKKGDRIMWLYKHHLNSKSVTIRVKHGTYIRGITIQRRDGGMSWPETKYAYVHFDGNKNPSRVLIRELKKDD